MHKLISTLHTGSHSLVVGGTATRTFDGRGVADLYRLLHEEPKLLRGASVADKVVGKGAAALMAAARIKRVYADVISQPALHLLNAEGIDAEYATLVPHIINRAGTGMCPLEARCQACATTEECLAQIDLFINEMRQK